jgi:hypothetical protein
MRKTEEELSSPLSRGETQEGTPRAKRPWQRPRILFREPLEVLAAVCQPAPPAKATITACRRGPISS